MFFLDLQGKHFNHRKSGNNAEEVVSELKAITQKIIYSVCPKQNEGKPQ